MSKIKKKISTYLYTSQASQRRDYLQKRGGFSKFVGKSKKTSDGSLTNAEHKNSPDIGA
jgi:hypothetical protein